jgi:hypothetical protein
VYPSIGLLEIAGGRLLGRRAKSLDLVGKDLLEWNGLIVSHTRLRAS